MPLIIPPGFGSAAFVFTSTTGTPPIVTTIGVDLSDVTIGMVGAANAMMAAYVEHLIPETDNSLTLDHVTLTVGQDGPGGSVDSSNAPVVGTRGGTGPPVSMATIVRKVTNVLGRRGRGRMFVPGLLTTTQVDENGIISAVRRDEIDAVLTAWATEFSQTPTTAMPPVLLHSSAPADPTPIVDLTTASLVGWIRGRIR